MSEERRRVLTMLAEGKVSVEEAERLLAALGQPDSAQEAGRAAGRAKYLRVVVDEGAKGDNVNVRVPLSLIHAGMKFHALIPQQVKDRIDEKLSSKGMSLNGLKLDADTVDELVSALQELAVDVDSASGEKIRIFCE